MTEAPSEVRVAAVQHPPVFQDKEATVERACDLIREAGDNGADIIAFSEGYISGYPAYYTGGFDSMTEEWIEYNTRFQDNSVRIPSDDTDRIGEAAADADAYVVMGCNELDDRRGGSTVYNSQFIVDPDGDLVLSRRKLMPTYTERTYHGFGDGSDIDVVDTGFGQLGALICWEHHMPLVRAAVIEKGEHFHVAAWPGNWCYGGEKLVEKETGARCDLTPAVREHAFEAGCFNISVNAIVDEADVPDDLSHLVDELDLDWACGGSSIVGPFGDYVTEPVFDDKTILYADCDMQMRKAAKTVFDPVGHYSRYDVATLDLNERSPRPDAPVAGRTPVQDVGHDRLVEVADEFDVALDELEAIVERLQSQTAAPEAPATDD